MKYFHKVANGKKRKSLITKMVIQGVETDDEVLIKNEAINFFSRLYTKEAFDRPTINNLFTKCLDEIEAFKLENVFSEEVKEVVFSKGGGPDGFTSLFYQECWDIIKDDLMKMFYEFHGSGIINKCTNATFIVLIPKKENVS